VLLDEGMLYFDARLSRNHPAVEVRIADVCMDPA
jgi:carboxylate-amine ligase